MEISGFPANSISFLAPFRGSTHAVAFLLHQRFFRNYSEAVNKLLLPTGLFLLNFAFITASPANQVNPQAVLQEARRLRAESKYEEALEKHVWFHQNALKHDPALAGVRLSFALSDWLRLASQYPPAGEALRGIRDENERRLEAGASDYLLFIDVSAINKALEAEERTLALFRKLDQERPAFAKEAFPVVEGALVQAKEYRLVRKHLPSPEKAFQSLAEKYRRLEGLAREHPNLDNPAYHAYREKSFREDVSGLIETLVATGDEDEARAILQKAEQVTPETAELRASVTKAVERGRQ